MKKNSMWIDHVSTNQMEHVKYQIFNMHVYLILCYFSVYENYVDRT